MTLWKVEQNLGNWTFKLRFKMAKYANRMNIKRNGIKEGICISFFEIVQFMHAQSCPSLCDPMDCILPGSSVHGIKKNTDVRIPPLIDAEIVVLVGS